MPEDLKQNVSFLFEDEIWKIVFEANSSRVAIELRNESTKDVKYIVWDLFDKNFTEISPFPGWLSSLSIFHNNKLIVQKYKQGGFPEAAGFTLIDALTGKVELEVKEGAVGFVSDQLLITSKLLFEKVRFQSFNFQTGEIKEIPEAEVNSIEPSETKIESPQQYLSDSIHFNTVKQFVKLKTKKEAVEGTEYFETELKIIVSYYIRAAEKLENFLLITDSKGNVLMDELINSNIQGIKKNSFFIKENLLIYIKDKKEFQSYVL